MIGSWKIIHVCALYSGKKISWTSTINHRSLTIFQSIKQCSHLFPGHISDQTKLENDVIIANTKQFLLLGDKQAGRVVYTMSPS